MKKTKKIVLLSMLVSQALVLSLIERLIPLPVAIPGVKLGLANVISFFTIIIFGLKDAIIVVILRTLLSSLFGGGVSSFMYSIAGGVLSAVIMTILYKYFKKQFSLPVISVTGAIFHNIGQLAMASFVISSYKLFSYLPVLTVSAVVTGLFIGFIVKYTLKPMKSILKLGSD